MFKKRFYDYEGNKINNYNNNKNTESFLPFILKQVKEKNEYKQRH